jgi:hypothetical protein
MDQLEHDGQLPMQRHGALERAPAAPDAMIANRPYSVQRPGGAELRRCAGSRFHPAPVAVLEQVLADRAQPRRDRRGARLQVPGPLRFRQGLKAGVERGAFRKLDGKRYGPA